jgi:hypothetical protein
MQSTLQDCYEALSADLAAISCDWDDLLWAVQVLHSRCFFDPSLGLHLSVPGAVGCMGGAACRARRMARI